MILTTIKRIKKRYGVKKKCDGNKNNQNTCGNVSRESSEYSINKSRSEHMLSGNRTTTGTPRQTSAMEMPAHYDKICYPYPFPEWATMGFGKFYRPMRMGQGKKKWILAASNKWRANRSWPLWNCCPIDFLLYPKMHSVVGGKQMLNWNWAILSCPFRIFSLKMCHAFRYGRSNL